MEYVYSAMLLHKTGAKIDETNITKVMQAAGAQPDLAKVKALVESLKDVDIAKAVKEAAMPVAAAAPTAGSQAAAKPAEDTKKKEEEAKKAEEAASAGLAGLFG